jgi:hypothetical protein
MRERRPVSVDHVGDGNARDGNVRDMVALAAGRAEQMKGRARGHRAAAVLGVLGELIGEHDCLLPLGAIA